MRRVAGVLLASIAALGIICGKTRAGENVDLLLVLATDVSGSVDNSRFRLQREGYAEALSSPRVIAAITSGAHRRVAICFVEWSGADAQQVVVDWTVVGDRTAARRFASRLLEAPRAFNGSTSISGAIDFAMVQLDRAPFATTRRVIDISGDGDNNAGRDVRAARDAAVAQGATINGLVIPTKSARAGTADHANPPERLVDFYRHNVIGGPQAFVMVAESEHSLSEAIIRKLIVEVAQGPP